MPSPADQLREQVGNYMTFILSAAFPSEVQNEIDDMMQIIDQYTANAVRAAELYGRLHQTIELFQQGELSAKSYSLLHDSITERISALNKETKG